MKIEYSQYSFLNQGKCLPMRRLHFAYSLDVTDKDVFNGLDAFIVDLQ